MTSQTETLQSVKTAFNAAIDFAISQGIEAATFLDAWRHGDTSEWPEFTTVRPNLASRQAFKPIEYVQGEWYKARDRDDLEAFFTSRLPAIREAAREHGYAIGLHGSLRRDMDLIAVPWSEGASDKEVLAHAIAVAACGITRDGEYEWTEKPLGRVATSIPCCWASWHNEVGTGHIDLSVTPAVRELKASDLKVLSEAVEKSLIAFDAFGEADDYPTMLELTRQMAALRRAVEGEGNA